MSEGETVVPSHAAAMFELTGSDRADASFVVNQLKMRGSLALSNDMMRLLRTRILYSDEKVTVSESLNRLMLKQKDGEHIIANFCIDMLDTVTFAERADCCHRANVRLGSAIASIVLSDAATQQAKRLQEEVALQFVSRHRQESEALPTIVDARAVQHYVMPYIRKTLTNLKVVPGISCLGWATDRSCYVLPGLTVFRNSTEPNNCAFHPSMPLLHSYTRVRNWAEVMTDPHAGAIDDLVRAIVAQIVRTFKHSPLSPITVVNDAPTLDAVGAIMRCIGQTKIHALNPNQRDRTNTDGVRGYPLFVTGGYHSQAVSNGHILLTDTGFRVPSFDAQSVESSGRFLQRAIIDAAMWCLRTDAVNLAETKSLDHNVALTADGTRIIELASGISLSKPQAVSTTPLLERIFASIPFADTEQYMSMSDALQLEIVSPQDIDVAGVEAELLSMGITGKVAEDNAVVCDAVSAMPALTRYYGARPKVRVRQELQEP